ncbi:hypothetical protein NSY32_10720 [Acinetobacter baumannii]|nr:hypothetical protein [Acinetobacter baumannii]
MIFELINPSDKCTFEAPNLKIAALVTCVLETVNTLQKELKTTLMFHSLFLVGMTNGLFLILG